MIWFLMSSSKLHLTVHQAWQGKRLRIQANSLRLASHKLKVELKA